MALSQEDLNNIQQLVQATCQQNNQNLMTQVQTMIQNQPTQPVVIPNTPAPAQQPAIDPYAVARMVAQMLNGQGYGANNNPSMSSQFGNLTVNDLMMYPPNVREAFMQNMMAATPDYNQLAQQIAQQIAQLDEKVDYAMWNMNSGKSSSKSHTALKVGVGVAAGAAIVGGVAYVKHRHHKHSKSDALLQLGTAALSAHYGDKIVDV